MEKDALIFCTGVVPAISSIVRKLTTLAEKVLIQTPVYNIFFNSIVNNGRQVLQSPLAYDGKNYSIDFERVEQWLTELRDYLQSNIDTAHSFIDRQLPELYIVPLETTYLL